MRAFLFFLGFILLCPVGSQASEDEGQAPRTPSLSREEKEARVRAVRDALQVARGKVKKGALLNKDVIDAGDCDLAGTIKKAAPQIQGAFLREVLGLTWVAKLNLCNNNLQSLDMDMGFFPCLEVLDLEQNKITKMPNSIGRCAHLRSLDLSSNRLGSLPDSLTSCKALIQIHLSNNAFTEFPNVLCGLRNLIVLNMNQNNLVALPQALGDLTSLEELYMSQCGLAALPSSLGQLKQLRVLHAAHNKITSLPQEMGELVSLRGAIFTDNRLQDLPTTLGCLTRLQRLDLSGNHLQVVPASLGGILTLRNLNLLTNRHLLPRGVGQDTWGREELEAHFGDRVSLETAGVVLMDEGTTKGDVYRILDAQEPRVNRCLLASVRVPALPTRQVYEGEEMLNALDALTREDMNGTGEDLPLLRRNLQGYVKTLYDMPLADGDVPGWKMYADQIPETKKALTYILDKIVGTQDHDLQAIWYTQLVIGLLHCPTGQAEGITAVAYGMLEGAARGSSFKSTMENILALKKNTAFTQAILSKTGGNTQNNHFISTYREKLKEELGLSAAIASFDERVGTMGADPFQGNRWNAARVYYDLVTPQRLHSWVAAHTQTEGDRWDLAVRGDLEAAAPTREPQGPIEGRLRSIERILQNPDLDFEEDECPCEDTLRTRRGELEAERAHLEKYKVLWAPQVSHDLTRVQDYMAAHSIEVPQGWFTPHDAGGVSMTKEGWRALMTHVKGRVALARQLRPLSTGDALDFMVREGVVDMGQESWWQGLFTADPMEGERGVLTPKGVEVTLIKLGFIMP
ncbi:MAG: leucine-rich repeat domain-containing protein [Proteobacteria bacterium]|nr:leucine-rich repeat domain-containing protein [Pseudomonadota bacterium]